MKKLISIMFAMLFVFSFSLSVNAQAKFEKMRDLNNYWAVNNAYPDWFCGIWTETGSLDNLVVAVLDTDEGNKGKEEILDLIEDDSSVSFTYGDYSRNYLIGIQRSLLTKEMWDLGLSHAAFLDDKSRLELGIAKEYKDNPQTIQMLEELKEKYGDVFVIEYVDGLYYTEDLLLTEDLPVVSFTPSAQNIITNEQPAKHSYFIYVVAFAIILFGISFVFLVFNRRKRAVLITDTGKLIGVSEKLSSKEVEQLIKNTEAEVPSDLEEKIMKEIEK